MYEKDYILRMIKQLNDTLARILGLKNNKNYEHAFEIIDKAMGDLLGLDLRLLRTLDANSLAEMIRDKHQLLVYLKLEIEEIDLLRKTNEHQRADKLQILIRNVSRTYIEKHGKPDDELQKVITSINT